MKGFQMSSLLLTIILGLFTTRMNYCERSNSGELTPLLECNKSYEENDLASCSSELEEVQSMANFDTDENTNSLNLTIFQTISQRKFWQLWTIFVAQSVMEGFINTYQKSFGMTFISDDFFFAYVGLAFNLLIGFSSLVWGYLYDLKGFKVIF